MFFKYFLQLQPAFRVSNQSVNDVKSPWSTSALSAVHAQLLFCTGAVWQHCVSLAPGPAGAPSSQVWVVLSHCSPAQARQNVQWHMLVLCKAWLDTKMCCCSVEENKDNIYGLNSIAKIVEGQALSGKAWKGSVLYIFFSGRMTCLSIRVIPKICDLIVVKLMPLFLKDQAIFAWSLVLPAERWSWLEIVAGAGEAGGRLGQGGRLCMGQWWSLPGLCRWECGLWECHERGCIRRERNHHRLLHPLTWDIFLIPS